MMIEVIIKVCELHSEGKDAKDIAEMLHMSEGSVEEIINLHYDGFTNGRIVIEDMRNFNTYTDIEEFIKKNYPPVEDKPGYVWFSRRNFQIIKIETLAEALICGARPMG